MNENAMKLIGIFLIVGIPAMVVMVLILFPSLQNPAVRSDRPTFRRAPRGMVRVRTVGRAPRAPHPQRMRPQPVVEDDEDGEDDEFIEEWEE
jgi:hypothetical protein